MDLDSQVNNMHAPRLYYANSVPHGETSASLQELLDLAGQLDKVHSDEWFRVEHLGRQPQVIAWSPEERREDRVQTLLEEHNLAKERRSPDGSD